MILFDALGKRSTGYSEGVASSGTFVGCCVCCNVVRAPLRVALSLKLRVPNSSPAGADLQSVSSFLCTVRAPLWVALSLLRTDINKHEALLSLFGVVCRLRRAKRKSPDFQCFTRQSPVFNSDVAASYAEQSFYNPSSSAK